MRFLAVALTMAVFGLQASEESHSQAGQDAFVHTMLYQLLGKQDAGYYLEIGAGEPVHINNTYAFEKNYEWQGVSIDISDNLMQRWYQARSNPLLSADATQLDYTHVLAEFPYVIDYLSLDVDGYYDTVLTKVMASPHVFKVITIEHDAYRYGDIYRSKEREILTAHGYYLLCPDVSHTGCAFEDWWIHPHFFPLDLFSQLNPLHLQDQDGEQIVQSLKMFISQ